MFETRSACAESLFFTWTRMDSLRFLGCRFPLFCSNLVWFLFYHVHRTDPLLNLLSAPEPQRNQSRRVWSTFLTLCLVPKVWSLTKLLLGIFRTQSLTGIPALETGFFGRNLGTRWPGSCGTSHVGKGLNSTLPPAAYRQTRTKSVCYGNNPSRDLVALFSNKRSLCLFGLLNRLVDLGRSWLCGGKLWLELLQAKGVQAFLGRKPLCWISQFKHG